MSATGIDTTIVDIYLWLLSGIHRRHHNAGVERFAWIESGFLGNDKSVEFIDTDIFEVHVGDQGVQSLAFRLTHIALQLGKHGNGSGHGHVLEHILLPRLTRGEGLARHLSGKIALYQFLGALIAHHGDNPLTIRINGITQLTATA